MLTWTGSLMFSWYPLVMTNIAIEHGHRNSEFSQQEWWFSIARLNYQRVCQRNRDKSWQSSLSEDSRIWQSIWQIYWHSSLHLLAFYLTNKHMLSNLLSGSLSEILVCGLAFYLTCILALQLTFYLTYIPTVYLTCISTSTWHSDIYSDILSDSYSDMFIWYIFSGIFSDTVFGSSGTAGERSRVFG